MQYEFLKQFTKRMKNVGLYALLFANSSQKMIWRQYGFDNSSEQWNVIFSVLLYLMEQSLKEERCVMEDIGAYIDTLNTAYFKKRMSYEDCCKLGDFIVNVVLSNEGRPMYFEGYDFESREYKRMHISYVANRIIYLDTEIKRTSYYLTDDGYSLLLGTLEIENNMKLTIHEMIFKLHLEKQSYDKAVDEMKNVFNLLRMQLQRIREAMARIRRNALNYSVTDYQNILESNMETIKDTRRQFLEYRDMVKERALRLEEEHINVHKLEPKEEENLRNLRTIEQYLNRAIDEHQKILNNHLDLKALYTKELEDMSQMSFIRRFSLRGELFDKILDAKTVPTDLEIFLRPLFLKEPPKAYNLNKAFEAQHSSRKKEETDSSEEIDFDEESWQRQQERLRQKKLEKYQSCLEFLLERLSAHQKITLAECQKEIEKEPEKKEQFIPNVEIFREVVVELLKSREIDIPALKKERREFIQERSADFELHEMLLQIVDNRDAKGSPQIQKICARRMEDGCVVEFENVKDAEGNLKKIRCSNILFECIY